MVYGEAGHVRSGAAVCSMVDVICNIRQEYCTVCSRSENKARPSGPVSELYSLLLVHFIFIRSFQSLWTSGVSTREENMNLVHGYHNLPVGMVKSDTHAAAAITKSCKRHWLVWHAVDKLLRLYPSPPNNIPWKKHNAGNWNLLALRMSWFYCRTSTQISLSWLTLMNDLLTNTKQW